LSQYYFLVSSLPYLLPRSDAAIGYGDFRETCQTHLSEKEQTILQGCILGGGAENLGLHPLLDRWIGWESALKNELVLLRAHNLKIEPEKWVRDVSGPAGLFDLAREAVHLDNPLEAENLLNEARWTFADELGVGHFFDFEALLVYSLKLQILERQRLFNRDRGTEEYRKVYGAVVDQISTAGV
jgi:hypothetical protein